MLNKIESISFSKYISKSFIKLLKKECLEDGMRGINVCGAWMPEMCDIADKVKTHINLDCPLSQNITDVRIAMIDAYFKVFGNNIDGFNVGPMTRAVNEGEWELLHKDFASIAHLCTKLNLNTRLMMNLPFFKSDEEVLRVANIAINNGFSEIMIGSTHKDTNVSDIILVGLYLDKHLKSKINVFGNFEDKKMIENASKIFNGIMLSPLCLFNLLEGV